MLGIQLRQNKPTYCILVAQHEKPLPIIIKDVSNQVVTKCKTEMMKHDFLQFVFKLLPK